MVTISRSKAVEVFRGLGLHTADGWNRKKMQQKLDSIHNLVPDDSRIGDEELDLILDRLIAAREMGEPIELLSDKQAAELQEAENGADPQEDPGSGPEDSESDEEPKEDLDGGEPDEDETAPIKPERRGKSKSKSRGTGGPSNKEKVYLLWQGLDHGDATPKQLYEKLEGELPGEIKPTTIRSWFSSWARGKGLPACAKIQD